MGGLMYEGGHEEVERGQMQEPVGVRKYLLLLQDSLAIKFSPLAAPSHPFPFAFNNKDGGGVGVNGSELPPSRGQFKSPNSNLETRTAEVDHSLHALYLYKGFRESNLQCYWNGALNETFSGLEYKGYIVPSTILVTALPRFLNILRTAWARQMLRSPPGYRIHFVGEIEELMAEPIGQGQFAPLSDSLCWAIFELTSIGEEAFVDSIMSTLKNCFPSMSSPSKELVYQTLEKLIRERKVYQTAHGYFVVTPDTFRYMTMTSSDPSPTANYQIMANRSFNQNTNFTLDALINSHNYESDKTSFSQNSWDSGENNSPVDPTGTVEVNVDPRDLIPQTGRGLKRHNSLKTFRQKDIAEMETREPFGRRSSSMRLSKSKSCGRVDDEEDEGIVVKGSKSSRRSTLSQLTSLVRNLKMGSGGSSSSGSDSPPKVNSNTNDRSSRAKGKWLFRKIFGRSSSKSRESNSSSPEAKTPLPLRCESVETQTSSSTEQLSSPIQTAESSLLPVQKTPQTLKNTPLIVNSSCHENVHQNFNKNSPPIPRQSRRQLESPVYAEPRSRDPHCNFQGLSQGQHLMTPNFPTFHHLQREESSRCSTLSQGTSSLGYGSQGYPSLNLGSGSYHNYNYSCNSPGHSPCPYDPQNQHQIQQEIPIIPCQQGPSCRSGLQVQPPQVQLQQNQPQPPQSNRQMSYDFYRRRYPSYSNSFSRSSPHYATVGGNSSSSQNPKVNRSPRPSPKNTPYEPLLTTTSRNTNSIPRPMSKTEAKGQESSSTVTQNVKSTTNMELELLLPLGNIMKAALNAKKRALKDDFFRKEYNREPPQNPQDLEKSDPDCIPVNLENSGVKLRVGEPKTQTEIKTTVDNNGLIETTFQTLPMEINQLKSEVEITLNEGGNLHVTKVTNNPIAKENVKGQVGRKVSNGVAQQIREDIRV